MTEKFGGEKARALKLYVVLARALQAVTDYTHAEIARHGLTPAEFAALEALHHKGPLLLGELQRKLLVSSGGITYLVDRLERKSLAERRPCATDRRATYAALTEAGQELMQRIFPTHVEAVERSVSGLDGEEQEAAIELLRRLGLAAADLVEELEARR